MNSTLSPSTPLTPATIRQRIRERETLREARQLAEREAWRNAREQIPELTQKYARELAY
jgi:hypothetical protein